MKRLVAIFFLFAFLFVGILSVELFSIEWNYAVTSFNYSFIPTNNKYNWKGTATHKEYTNWVDHFTVEVIYYKVPGTLNVTISKNKTPSGQSFSGKFKAKCNEDPILYGGVMCSPMTTLEGNFNALPDDLVQNRDLCSIGIMLPVQTRESLRKEYEAMNQGPFTLAPFPVSPKENSTQPSKVKFEMFLPFRFAKPCGGWRFQIFLERYDPKAHIYKWIKVDTGKPIKGWQGKNFECRARKELKLKPGKYRFKLQAEHYQHGKTPWSLPFEFTVKFTPLTKMLKLKTGIFVTFPNGGESLRIREEPYILTWNNVGLPRELLQGDVVIALRKGGKWFKTLKERTSCRIGKARVKITNEIPVGSDYKIRVRSLVDHKVFDDSDANFSVIKLKLEPMKRIK